MSNKSTFTPPWHEGVTPVGTWRSLFKWGDLQVFKHPNRGFFSLLEETFGMRDEDFTEPRSLGLEPLPQEAPITLDPRHIELLTAIVGPENVRTDAYSRVRASYGKAMIDALRLRRGIIENIPDLVLAPRSTQDVLAILRYCDEQGIPIYVYGAGSSVTRGMEAVCGGITLDMSVHMNQVIAFSEVDQTITVQPGMTGPQLEKILNEAPRTLNAQRGYTCGHFPQSFEYSSVGGWVVTRGAGQNSTYYGKIEDIAIAQEYVTPHGILQTPPQPRSATGPDIDQIMLGSEGTFGILTAVTLKVCRFQPENTRRYGYLFKSWEAGREACRKIMQGEFGYPSIFRLSDPEETDVALRMYHIHGTPADTFLRMTGYQPMQRCLLLGSSDGDRDFTRLVQQKVHRICTQHGAFTLTPFRVTQAWEHSRFRDPYMREDLEDFGILIDTLECAVTWSQMDEVYQRVRGYVKSRPQTVCMTHLSHAYPQGANLYFIFIGKIDSIQEYLKLQYGVIEAIQQSGAAMSHHHGMGKQTSPWLEGQIGKPSMDVIRALKRHFDPHNILNPGGTLGFDMTEEQKNKKWSMDPH